MLKQLHNCFLSQGLSSFIFIFYFKLDLISHSTSKIRWPATAWVPCNTQTFHYDGYVDQSLKVCPSRHFFSPSVAQKTPDLWEAAPSCHWRPSWKTHCSSSQSHAWQHKCQFIQSCHTGYGARGKTWEHQIGCSIVGRTARNIKVKQEFTKKMKFSRWSDFISLDWTSWVCSKQKKIIGEWNSWKFRHEIHGFVSNFIMKK